MRYLITILLFISVNAFGQKVRYSGEEDQTQKERSFEAQSKSFKIQDSTRIKDSILQVEGRKFVAEYAKGALTDFDKWAYQNLSAKDYNEKFTQWMGAYLQEVYKGYLEKKTKTNGTSK